MCRNIKTLANFEPAATDAEIRASALQFVRKLSGATRPSRANEAAFDRAVEEVAAAAQRLIQSLTTTAAPRNREEEFRKARERSLKKVRVMPFDRARASLPPDPCISGVEGRPIKLTLLALLFASGLTTWTAPALEAQPVVSAKSLVVYRRQQAFGSASYTWAQFQDAALVRHSLPRRQSQCRPASVLWSRGFVTGSTAQTG